MLSSYAVHGSPEQNEQQRGSNIYQQETAQKEEG